MAQRRTTQPVAMTSDSTLEPSPSRTSSDRRRRIQLKQPTQSTNRGIYCGSRYSTGNSPAKSYKRRKNCIVPKENMKTTIFSVKSIEATNRGFGLFVYTKEDDRGLSFIEHHDIWKCQNGPNAVDEWLHSREEKYQWNLLLSKKGVFFRACEDYVLEKRRKERQKP